MILKMNVPVRIENLRHHPAEAVERLRSLLVSGVNACPDSRRNNSYDVEDGDRIFYIHVSPSGTVLLLAAWRKEGAPLATLRAPVGEAIACCG